jgi:hypothetical protein
MNYAFSQIFVFDDNWNFLSNQTSIFMPHNMISVGKFLFIANPNYLCKTDLLFNVIKTVITNTSSMYYNNNNSLIYGTITYGKLVSYYDLNLTFIGSFSLYPYQLWSITGYNNQMFVGTMDGNILVIFNQTIQSIFNGCNGYVQRIMSILIDVNENMATVCENSQIYLYNSAGYYQNKKISTSSRPQYASFDSKLRLVVIYWNNGIDIYN